MFSWKTLQRNKTVKYGVPMLLLVIGGSFGLREFTQIRYDAQKIRKRVCTKNSNHRLAAGPFTGGEGECREAGGHPGGGVREVEGDSFGRVEEHPWSPSLGGLQGVPGAAAQQSEQNTLRLRTEPTARAHTDTQRSHQTAQGPVETAAPVFARLRGL
uniref:Cytochrome c oxidase assembly protein COX16 homolog, mitochondrial n=1 Tax=Poecilia formosa TaxID=48698 RepID=A0A096MH47_POEFO